MILFLDKWPTRWYLVYSRTNKRVWARQSTPSARQMNQIMNFTVPSSFLSNFITIGHVTKGQMWCSVSWILSWCTTFRTAETLLMIYLIVIKYSFISLNLDLTFVIFLSVTCNTARYILTIFWFRILWPKVLNVLQS